MKKLKQLFCEHYYVSHMRDKHTYLSSGDEYQDRRSYEYYLICRKCKHRIDIVDTWKNEEIKKLLK